jgi:hypothetical protein
MKNLLDNQVKAIDKLRRYKVGALFMEPGTGKTRAAYELVKSVPEVNYILWLTPFQTKENLAKEINLCGGLNNLEIAGIESLSNSDRLYLELRGRVNKYNSFVICDESLKIKNWQAKRTKRILDLGSLAEYKLVLNGSPITRNLLDLWPQMEFLSPKILGMDLTEFKNTFCETVEITKRYGNKSYTREFIKAYHNIDYLYNLIKFYVFEADLDLGIAQNYHSEHYYIDDDIKEEYYRLKHKYLDDEKLLAMNNNIFLEMTQKMQHTYSCTDNKFNIADAIIQKHGKALIFCKYIDSQRACEIWFPNAKVLSYGKHSFGLNLQDYNVTIYFDKTFDYAQRLQAGYRTYRTGQNKDCQYYDLTGDVGLERVINENIEKKMNMLEYFKSKTIEEIKKEL